MSSNPTEPRIRSKRWLMTAVILGSSIVFLDTTVVSLAQKQIGDELPRAFLGKLEGLSYVFGGYFVTLSALLILAGAMNDYYGRKRMFTFGLIGFGVTSMLCGLAPSMEWLIAFRLLQGATGAFLVPGSLSIITASFSGEEQGRAFGIWAGASAATSILGPFVGGVLVNTLTWRAAFFINAPFVLLAIYATLKYVPESRDEEASGQFDWVGAALVAVGVGGLAFGAIRGQQTSFAGTGPVLALGVGALATAMVPVWMAKTRNPLVPLSLFRSRNFTVTNISTFLIYGALYTSLNFQALFLIGTLGYSEPAAAIAGIPATLFLALFSTRFGALAARHGPRRYMTLGPLIMAAGLLWLARFPTDSRPWILGTGTDPLTGTARSIVPPADYFIDLFPALIVFGIGLTIMVAPLTTALMTSVPSRNAGVASAINNAISRIGTPLIVALVFIAMTASFYRAIQADVPSAPVSSPEFRGSVSPLAPPDPTVEEAVARAAKPASTESFRLAMLVASALLLAGAFVNGIGIRNRPSAGGSSPGADGTAEPAGAGFG
jgi:EmrB/QacA subfamily drug resistance transporter